MADSLEKKLEKLRQEYILSLPGKLREISSLAEQVGSDTWNNKKRDYLMTLVHRMAGSGKTFGVEGLSETALSFEIFLKKELLTGKQVTVPIKNEILDFVQKLIKIERTKNGKKLTIPQKVNSNKNEQTTESKIITTEKTVFLFFQNKVMPELEDQFQIYGYITKYCKSITELEQYTPFGQHVILIFDIQRIKKESKQLEFILKKSGGKKDVNIVVLSIDDTINKRLIAARSGADAFMTLPMDVHNLINKLHRISQNRGSDPYHILIVDDDVEFVAWCAYILQQAGMITSVVSNPEHVISQLIESRPELVLMDWYMPGYSGFDLVSIIRQQDAFVSIPILFLTSENDPKKKIKALRLGVDEFLNKPISPEHLVESVRIRAERYRILRFYMERDSLTGLFNHSKIVEFLTNELSRVHRYEMILSFAMIDIDHFKKVNDTYGHLNGDRVLKDLANLLKERLRKNDFIGRYGGEEFAIIFPNTEPEAAIKALNKIRESFAKMVHRAKNKSFTVTFSAGVSSTKYSDEPMTLIHSSDIALYNAKSQGRNRIILFDPT